MSILKLIANNNFITVNKTIIKTFGLEEATIIGELASELDYWTKKGGLLENNWFYSTIENIEENTGISEFKQRKALKHLVELGVIDIKIKGLPAKRYIKINEEQLAQKLNIQLYSNSIPSSLEIKELGLQKSNGNNNINNNNINNNIKEKEKKESNNPSEQEVESNNPPNQDVAETISCEQEGNGVYTRCIQNGNKMYTQDRLGKDSIELGKDSIEKLKTKKKKETDIDTLINEKINDEEVKETLYEFIKMRKAIKKPITTHGLELLINKLYKIAKNKEEAIEILDNSIMNNWQGIFELKEGIKETPIQNKQIPQKWRQTGTERQYNKDFFEKCYANKCIIERLNKKT